MTAPAGGGGAKLIADRGDAAAGDQFFRSGEFFAAERVTHTLRIEHAQGALLAPVIVREVPDTELIDAVSPYGYPGLSGGAPDPPLDPDAVDFSATGLISLFLRHRLDGDPPLAGSAERSIVQVADPTLAAKSRMSDRQQIRRNIRRGYAVEVLAGPESTASQRRGFLEAYEQTMHRAGAPQRYFFGAEYFDLLLGSPASRLALATDPSGGIAAGSVAVLSDGFLHYYLSGTADTHLRDSPMKNIVSALCELATELGLPLNLGGGLSPGDPLEEFKRGFANREQGWRTSSIICDATAYGRLAQAAGGGGRGDYFPAYRAPSEPG